MKIYQNHDFKRALKNYFDALEELSKFSVGQKVVCDIGEQFASRILKIRIIKEKNNPSIDGIDADGKRVQIKTRHAHRNNPNPYAFRPFNIKSLKNIDYALLIILGDNFWVKEIWRIERRTLQKHLQNKSSDSFNLTSGIKKYDGVKRIYP